MLFGRDRVEEDLARIRRANLPPERLARLEAEEEAAREEMSRNRPGAKDLFAMTVAALSVIGPYVLIFIGIMVLTARLVAT